MLLSVIFCVFCFVLNFCDFSVFSVKLATLIISTPYLPKCKRKKKRREKPWSGASTWQIIGIYANVLCNSEPPKMCNAQTCTLHGVEILALASNAKILRF